MRAMLLGVGLILPGLCAIAAAANFDAAPASSQPLLATGQVSVVAEVRSGIPQLGEVVIYVFRRDSHDDIVAAMRAGERVTMGPGQYDLRAVLMHESEERDIQWLRDVKVEAGSHTERRVIFKRGALLVRAQNVGRPLPLDAVSLSVHRSGDGQEEVIVLGSAGEPLDLAPGRYDVKATFAHSIDRPERWLRGLQLTSNEIYEATVEFSSGTLAIGATSNGGKPVGSHHVYIYYYRVGDHAQPVGYTPSGAPAVLEAGVYDIRAHYFRSHDQPTIWLRNVVVHSGRVTVDSVAFPSAELLIRVYDANGTELLGDNVVVDVYAPGQRKHPIASARGSEMLTLTEDVYDIRLQDTRHPEEVVWLPSIRLQAGTPTVRDVVLGAEN